ncbi:hypothetical protein [Leptospira sp. 'Mane']|uniref:hypothetical protein n=1 Tax=Leptospira sp. 'Mane' TaxID=3387407 RepID=UPI00398B0CA9
MKEKLIFPDHRSASNRFPKSALIIIVSVTIISFFGFAFVGIGESELDPIVLFIIIPVFIAFSIIPFILFFQFTSRSKKTILDPDTQSIELWEGKKQIKSFRFTEISSFLQSRYTYTVRSKNNTRTVIVYTVISPEAPDIVFAESTNPVIARNFAETFAKTLKTSLTSEKGETRDPHELDLPFYKRPGLEFDAFSVPEFKKESALSWEEKEEAYLVSSKYNPSFYKWIGSVISIVSFLVLNLVFGSALELNVFYWESFPPDVWQLVFLGGTILVALVPVSFVYFQGLRTKEIVLSKDKITSPSGSMNYDQMEEIYLDNGDIVCIGDEFHLRVSLFFFCDNEYYEAVKNAVFYGIMTQARGKGGTDSAKFATES